MAETSHQYDDFELDLTRGDDVTLTLTVTKHILGVESAQDLTGAVVWVTGKRDLGDADEDAVFQLNSDDLGGVTITSAAAGLASADLMPEHTEDLTDQKTTLWVDCAFVDAAGKRRTFQTGKLHVYRDATISG
jgi:hypothetical protein